MLNKCITSEEPDLHWSFLDFKGKTVLDLGCGKFYSKISTAEWFVKSGASKIIGIDLGVETFHHDKFTYHRLNIDSSEKLKDLIETYKPEVIKADIEGAEVYFNDLSIEELFKVKEIAVEYHSNDLKLGFESKLLEWGFKIIDTYGLFTEDINRVGVIHAKKTK